MKSSSRSTPDRKNLFIGVGKACYQASPPSEPDVQFSRIRLSSRWFYLRED